MDANLACPFCHILVRPTDFFCFNCGHNLHPKPLSTAFASQFTLYLKTVLLPPLGIIWGIRYLRQTDRSSKIVGVIVILVTLVELIWLTKYTFDLFNTVNKQMNDQLKMYQGF